MSARRVLLLLLSLLLCASLALLPACGGEEPAEPEEVTAPAEEEAEAPEIDEVAEIIAAADEYLSSEFSQNWIVNAPDVYELVFEQGDESFQIIDLREPADYATGHIEGAINIPYEEIVDEDQLAKLDPEKTQLLVDYDGSKATGVVLVYSQLGYDAMFIRFGISGWTTDPEITGGQVWDGVGKDFPLTTEGFTAEPQYDLPTLDTGAADRREAIINATKAFIGRGGNSNLVSADELNEMIQSGADFTLISAVGPEHHELGHLEGALLIGRAALPNEESLAKIDPDKKVVVYCYQGHNSGLMQMLLGQLGYDIDSLHYGIGAWTNNAEVRGVPMYDPANVKNFATVAGS